MNRLVITIINDLRLNIYRVFLLHGERVERPRDHHEHRQKFLVKRPRHFLSGICKCMKKHRLYRVFALNCLQQS